MDEREFLRVATERVNTVVDGGTPDRLYFRFRVGTTERSAKSSNGGGRLDIPPLASADTIAAIYAEGLSLYLDDRKVWIDLMEQGFTSTIATALALPEGGKSGAGDPKEDKEEGWLSLVNAWKELGTKALAWAGEANKKISTLEVERARIDGMIEAAGNAPRVDPAMIKDVFGMFREIMVQKIETPDDAIRQAESLAAVLAKAKADGVQLTPDQQDRIAAVGMRIGAVLGITPPTEPDSEGQAE